MPQFLYCAGTTGQSNFAVRDLLHSSGRATGETFWPTFQKIVAIPAIRSLLGSASSARARLMNTKLFYKTQPTPKPAPDRFFDDPHITSRKPAMACRCQRGWAQPSARHWPPSTQPCQRLATGRSQDSCSHSCLDRAALESTRR